MGVGVAGPRIARQILRGVVRDTVVVRAEIRIRIQQVGCIAVGGELGADQRRADVSIDVPPAVILIRPRQNLSNHHHVAGAVGKVAQADLLD